MHPAHKALPPAAALLILSFLGIADAAYLATAAMDQSALSCSVSGLDGCNTVAQSVYSHVLGIPLANFGVVFYALFFILAGAYLVMSVPSLARILKIFGVFGIAASVVFMLVQFILIKALCIYCLGSALVALLIFLTTRLLPRHLILPKAVVLG